MLMSYMFNLNERKRCNVTMHQMYLNTFYTEKNNRQKVVLIMKMKGKLHFGSKWLCGHWICRQHIQEAWPLKKVQYVHMRK